MAYLLEIAGHPEGQGIRPQSLKVTAISAIMAEVEKARRIFLGYRFGEITGRARSKTWLMPTLEI